MVLQFPWEWNHLAGQLFFIATVRLHWASLLYLVCDSEREEPHHWQKNICLWTIGIFSKYLWFDLPYINNIKCSQWKHLSYYRCICHCQCSSEIMSALCSFTKCKRGPNLCNPFIELWSNRRLLFNCWAKIISKTKFLVLFMFRERESCVNYPPNKWSFFSAQQSPSCPSWSFFSAQQYK